jgi:hypothetical protein
MAITFGILNELDVGSLTVGGNFIYCNGLRLQAGTVGNSTLMISDSGAFATQSSFLVASGALNSQVIASGSLLYQLLQSTGQQLTVFVNGVSGNLAVTGQTLFNYVNTESGIIVNQLTALNLSTSGALSGSLAATGQALYLDMTGFSGANNLLTALTGQGAWTAANNNAINLSGQLAGSSGTALANLGATGQALYLDMTGFSGANNTLTQSTGQQAWNAANNNGINLSGQLATTGQSLYKDITGLSGQAALAYETQTNFTIGTGQLGGTISSNATNLSGLLAASGAVLEAQILLLSGIITTDYVTTWTGRNFNITAPNFNYAWSGSGFAGNGTGILPAIAGSSGFVFYVKNKSFTLPLVISGNIDNSQNFTIYPLSNYGFWSDGQTYNIE